MNFFFEIVYKKNIFGSDGLLKRKQYSRNPPPDKFEDSSDDEKNNILVLLRKDKEKIPLELEEFYEDIDL